MFTLPVSGSRSSTRRQLLALTLVFLLGLILPGSSLFKHFSTALADTTPQTLPFTQNWANTGLVTTNDDWSGVPGVIGYRGDGLVASTAIDPQTVVADGSATPIDVNANLATPNTFTTGGVAEFDGIPDPVVALQGSGTADAPHIVLTLNTTGQTGINVSYNLRDVDGSADNSIQPVALQYRIGATGNYTNIPAGFVADASTGPSATQSTPVSVALPVACENQANVQLRMITTDAVGSDEWVGVDDINISTGPTVPSLNINNVTQAEGDAGTSTFTFQVSLTAAAAGNVTFDIATADGTAQDDNPPTEDNDYVANSEIGKTITAGNLSTTFAVTVNGDTTLETTETFFVNITNVAGANAGDVQGLGTITNDEVTITPICQIQGSGTASPIPNGTNVTTTGVVTGIKQGSSGGFFIQDEPCDGNPLTSDGIFVFTGASVPAGVAVSNQVQVSGNVLEFIPSADLNQNPVTELSGGPITVNVLSTGNPLPTPVALVPSDTTNPSGTSDPLDTLEEYEGMRVFIQSFTVVAPTQGSIDEDDATSTSNGVFFGVVTGVARPFREAGVNISDPLPAGAPANVPRFDENPERIRIDSDSQPATTPFDAVSGQIISNLVGPLDYSFRAYTILPDPGALAASTPLTFTAVPVPRANEFTVASFNAFHFFDTNDDPGVSDVVLTPTAFNNRLNKISLAIRNVMRTPDVIGVQEFDNLGTLQAVATRVNNDAVTAGDPNPNYQAYLVEGHDIGGIDVGFLVKAARVTVVDVTQIEQPGCNPATPTTCNNFINPNTGLAELLNDRPPLVLRATIARPAGGTVAFTVIVNHLRSLIDVEADNDAGRRTRAKRQAGAEFLANLIQTRQTADPAERIIAVGDMNAFQVNDGYADVIGTIKGTPPPDDQTVVPGDGADLVNPDLTDLVDTLTPDQPYSYTFDGNAQVLDHVLVNEDALAINNRFAYARNNADFPTIYYGDSLRPERLSDHDMPVAYFSLGGLAAGSVLISEFRFRGPSGVFGQAVDGSHDEYVELYNNTDSPIIVSSADSTGGWSLAYLNGGGTNQETAAIIPNGTVIPARGHYLLTNEVDMGQESKIRPRGGSPLESYSLASYAVGDQNYREIVNGKGTVDIDDDGAIAIFQTADENNFSAANRLDAVSLNAAVGALADLYREGTNLPSPGANDGQYAYVRKLLTGLPQDTNNNAADFFFVSTDAGSYGGVQSQLGAPGPENKLSPIQRNVTVKPQLIEPTVTTNSAPNRVRDLTPVTNGALGTLSVRRRFINQTGGPVTRLRFRVVEITTLNSPGYSPGGPQADVRMVDGADFDIMTTLGALTVRGLTVEQPLPLTQPLGGGLNSSLTVVIPGGVLVNGATIDVHFLLGVQQGGVFRAYVNVEALP